MHAACIRKLWLDSEETNAHPKMGRWSTSILTFVAIYYLETKILLILNLWVTFLYLGVGEVLPWKDIQRMGDTGGGGGYPLKRYTGLCQLYIYIYIYGIVW